VGKVFHDRVSMYVREVVRDLPGCEGSAGDAVGLCTLNQVDP
jgi:hypothetical protein